MLADELVQKMMNKIILSLLISIYNEYILDIKLGFLFILFGAILRFYNINICKGILHNYMNKPKYKTEIKEYCKEKKDFIKVPGYVIPFKDSWYLHAIDFLSCLLILSLFIYSFNSILNGAW